MIPDDNIERLLQYLLIPSHLILFNSVKHSGKKTIVKHCLTQLNMKYKICCINDIESNINESLLIQENIVLIINIDTLKDPQLHFIKHSLNLRFIKFVMTCHTFKHAHSFLSHSILFSFKVTDTETNHIKALKQKPGKFSNIIDLNYTNFVDNLKNMSFIEIRNECMNFVKNNFDFIPIYHKIVAKFYKKPDVLQMASKCQHMSLNMNKQLYALEYFIFYVKWKHLMI